MILWWNPVVSGKAFMRQFLRIGAAGMALGRGEDAQPGDGLRARLGCGEVVEVSGYEMAPALVADLEALQLADHAPGSPVLWCEGGGEEPRSIAPAGAAVIERWKQAGVSIRSQAVKGDEFWAGIDIVEARDLVACTLDVMTAMVPA